MLILVLYCLKLPSFILLLFVLVHIQQCTGLTYYGSMLKNLTLGVGLQETIWGTGDKPESASPMLGIHSSCWTVFPELLLQKQIFIPGKMMLPHMFITFSELLTTMVALNVTFWVWSSWSLVLHVVFCVYYELSLSKNKAVHISWTILVVDAPSPISHIVVPNE